MTQRGKGRPRDGATLWRSRQRKGTRIRQRLESSEMYIETDGTVWEIAGTVAGPCIRVSQTVDGVKIKDELYPTIKNALDAELYNAKLNKREE